MANDPPAQKKAEYEGREVTLYDPFRIEDDEKKFAVYVENPDSGRVNKIKFGSANMEIKRDQPDNLKNFRSRFSCDDDPADPHEARFWACYFWREDLSVSDILDEMLTEFEWDFKQSVKSLIRENFATKNFVKGASRKVLKGSEEIMNEKGRS